MTSPTGIADSFEALPNPRGGAVRLAERALADAQHAFQRQGDTLGALRRAINALHAAGWQTAQQFAETLALVAPLGEVSNGSRARFADALRDFGAAVERRNLRELACSTTLFGHYRALNALIAAHTRAAPVAFDDLALGGRAIAPATLRPIASERLARVRAHYERALLVLLRSPSNTTPGTADNDAESFGRLDECLQELAGQDPYDFWRLAASTVRSLRTRAANEPVESVVENNANANANASADAKRLYARFNLVLADQAHASSYAPKSLVRATLALLWRDLALGGASADDAAHVDVLRDYGLTVDWHVAATEASDAAWKAGASEAGAPGDTATEIATRDLGVLRVNAAAYEDFLQGAETSIDVLLARGNEAREGAAVDEQAALHAADASYRLGAAACALGLGHVALLADTLGLAWRRIAYEGANGQNLHTLDPAVPERAAQTLGAMLHQAAAGIAPSEAGASVAALTVMIERPAPIR